MSYWATGSPAISIGKSLRLGIHEVLNVWRGWVSRASIAGENISLLGKKTLISLALECVHVTQHLKWVTRFCFTQVQGPMIMRFFLLNNDMVIHVREETFLGTNAPLFKVITKIPYKRCETRKLPYHQFLYMYNKKLPKYLTMNQWSIEPLHVVAIRVPKQDLIADDRHR